MNLWNTLNNIKTKFTAMDSAGNRPIRLGYTENAFTNNVITGTPGGSTGNVIPGPNASDTDLNSTLMDTGFSITAATLPRKFINQILGRLSFNSAKTVEQTKELITTFDSYLKAGTFEWDSTRTYAANEVCFAPIDGSTVTSLLYYKSLVNDNLNNALSDTTKWLPLSSSIQGYDDIKVSVSGSSVTLAAGGSVDINGTLYTLDGDLSCSTSGLTVTGTKFLPDYFYIVLTVSGSTITPVLMPVAEGYVSYYPSKNAHYVNAGQTYAGCRVLNTLIAMTMGHTPDGEGSVYATKQFELAHFFTNVFVNTSTNQSRTYTKTTKQYYLWRVSTQSTLCVMLGTTSGTDFNVITHSFIVPFTKEYDVEMQATGGSGGGTGKTSAAGSAGGGGMYGAGKIKLYAGQKYSVIPLLHDTTILPDKTLTSLQGDGMLNIRTLTALIQGDSYSSANIVAYVQNGDNGAVRWSTGTSQSVNPVPGGELCSGLRKFTIPGLLGAKGQDVASVTIEGGKKAVAIDSINFHGELVSLLDMITHIVPATGVVTTVSFNGKGGTTSDSIQSINVAAPGNGGYIHIYEG